MPSRCAERRRARPLLGTIVEIAVANTAPAGAADASTEASTEAAFCAAFGVVERVHRLMSFHEPSSDVSRINAAAPGVEVDVDPSTFEVLARAIELGEASGGAFDITIAPALVRRGFLPRPAARAADPAASFRDLLLRRPAAVCWRRPGWIDLGGIAKGYAVDRAIDALRARGVPSALVNAGGDLRCFGAAQPIHVPLPGKEGRYVALGMLDDAAIATSSGTYTARWIEGRRRDPLADRTIADCIAWAGSVSVAAPDCTTADALTKIVGLDPQRAPALLARLGAQASILSEAGLRRAGARVLGAMTSVDVQPRR